MKKKYIISAIIGVLFLSFCGKNAFATENYLAELEKDLVNNELTIKSEDPKNNPDLIEIICGILQEKYGLTVSYNYETKDYYNLTFTKQGEWRMVWHTSDDGMSSWGGNEPEILAEKTVKVKYTGVDQEKKAKILAAMADIKAKRHWGESLEKVVRYNVYDLSFVNYVVTAGYYSWVGNDSVQDYYETTKISNRMASFSPEFREDLANKNIQLYIDNRAGDGDAFYESAVGFAAIISDGYIYDAVSSAGATTRRLLFIPESTPDTHEAYAAAAQKRIDDYYKGTEYEGKVTVELDQEYDINDDFGYVNLNDGWTPIDASYRLKYENISADMVIEKNDAMISEPVFTTGDVYTNITVISDDSTIPLDTVVIVNKINNKDRTDVINKLGLKDADIYDINLHSDAASRDIVKLPNGKFLVRIPVDQKYEGRKLAVYYIDVNGKVETHEVTVRDGYAEFETNHFSEYILGTTEDAPTNPGTLDAICAILAVAAGCAAVFLSNLKLATKRR